MKSFDLKQLDHDTPPNQLHRAEIVKLLVHPDFRRQGIAKTLMAAVEDHARDLRRSLITLDSRTGDYAESLYTSLDYTTANVIPGDFLHRVEGYLVPTTIMYKDLSGSDTASRASDSRPVSYAPIASPAANRWPASITASDNGP